MKKILAVYLLIAFQLTGGPASAQDSLNVSQLGLIHDSWDDAYDVAIVGTLAYVAASQSGLRIVNVADPSNPLEIGFCDTPGSARGVAVLGDYAYVADYTPLCGLRVINIMNPAAPFEVGFDDQPGIARGVAVRYGSGGILFYVADDYSGLRILYDTDPPTSPIEVGWQGGVGSAYDVAVAGNYAYVAMDWFGLQVIDVTIPHAPTQAAVCFTGGMARGVAVAGNYVYMADGNGGLRVINITDPALPFLAGSYDTPGYAYGVAVAGNYAYVADGNSGLRVINITDSAAPFEAGFYDTPGSAFGVAVDGCRAYVADSVYFGIYDISYFAPCPSTTPMAPDSLTVQYAPETDDLILRWAPVLFDTSGAALSVDYYVVMRGEEAEMDSIGIPDPPDTTFFIDSTATGTLGFYQVKAVTE